MKTIEDLFAEKSLKHLGQIENRKVKTISELKPTTGFLVHKKHIDARKPDIYGYIGGWVPGHGGDVQWVIQDKHKIGCYRNNELILQD